MKNIDIEAVLFLQDFLGAQMWIPAWQFVSDFLAIAAFIMPFVFYVSIDRDIGFEIVTSVAVTFLITTVLKIGISERRPFVSDGRIRALDNHFPYGSSFPSSHCSLVSSCINSIYSEYRFLFSFRKLFYSVVLALIMLSRVVLGMHYLHDCLGGLAIGYVVGFVIVFVFKAYENVIYGKNAIVSLVLVALGMAGIALAQYGKFDFFRETVSVSYLVTAYGSFVFGDSLEREFIGVDCSGRALKRMMRFVVLLLFLYLLYFIYFRIFETSFVSRGVFIIWAMIFVSFAYTLIGVAMNLFERPDRINAEASEG